MNLAPKLSAKVNYAKLKEKTMPRFGKDFLAKKMFVFNIFAVRNARMILRFWFFHTDLRNFQNVICSNLVLLISR